MKKILLICAVLVCAALYASTMVLVRHHPFTPPPLPAIIAHRYELTMADGQVMVFDTATGLLYVSRTNCTFIGFDPAACQIRR